MHCRGELTALHTSVQVPAAGHTVDASAGAAAFRCASVADESSCYSPGVDADRCCGTQLPRYSIVQKTQFVMEMHARPFSYISPSLHNAHSAENRLFLSSVCMPMRHTDCPRSTV